MATTLMSLHVASDGESLITALMRAFIRFFACMTMIMNFQTGRTGEGFAANWAYIFVNRLHVRRRGGCWCIVVVLIGLHWHRHHVCRGVCLMTASIWEKNQRKALKDLP